MWFFQKENLAQKFAAAEAITQGYLELKSPNELYDRLKYIDISLSDIDYYNTLFASETYVHLLAIASMNRSGFVREKAIRELGKLQNRNGIKFILLRLGDWVAAVRKAALEAIRAFLSPDFFDIFLQNLPLVDWLLFVQRADLLGIHNEIIDFVLSKEFTADLYQRVKKHDEKTRLIYFKYLFNKQVVDEEIVHLVLNDKNYLIRAALVKQVQHLATSKRKELVSKFLQDRAAKVRVAALYETRAFDHEFEPTVIELTSDESASVRYLARFLLKDRSLNLADIYRQRLLEGNRISGSILGLSEVGTKNDLPTFETYIQVESVKVKLACLIGIHRIDRVLSKKYSLEFLSHPNSRLRTKSSELLSFYNDDEVLERARSIFLHGGYEEKKTSLRLFNQIGGWNIVGDLILALTDKDENIQNLAWTFLETWKGKAARLFTTPAPAAMERAHSTYHQLDLTKTTMSYNREALWNSLPFFLRR